VAYNAGRVASYSLLGAAFGALGSLSTGLLPFDTIRTALRVMAAVAMLVVGLHLAGLPSAVKALEDLGAPVWKRVAPFTRRFLPLRSPWHALVLGGLWGFMPCGLLYGALALAASTQAPTAGALTMAAFGLATLPVMLTTSALASSVTGYLAHPWVRRTAGAVVLGFGLWSSASLLATAGVGGVFGLVPHHACCPR
jgi:sulfite exporter TauE/SafE